jgi:hypothetical protein
MSTEPGSPKRLLYGSPIVTFTKFFAGSPMTRKLPTRVPACASEPAKETLFKSMTLPASIARCAPVALNRTPGLEPVSQGTPASWMTLQVQTQRLFQPRLWSYTASRADRRLFFAFDPFRVTQGDHPMKVIVAIFRDQYDRLFQLSNADYHACVSAAEFARWKDTVARVVTESEGLECKRATPYDQAQMAKAIATAKTRMSQADVRMIQLRRPHSVPETI